MKVFLPVYSVSFLLLALVLPTWRVWRSTGVNPYKLGASDSAGDYVGSCYRWTLLACALVISLYALWPSAYRGLLPIPYLSGHVFMWIGSALLLFALVSVLVAQLQMRGSWRIGIDQEVKTDLVQHGLFRVSRNPIFLGMRFMLLGVFLILPTAVMLAILCVGEVLTQIQVRLEEDFLTRLHGESYIAYQREVRRWI